MINAVFRYVLDGDRKIRQWKDADDKNAEWKNVSIEEEKKYKQSTRCTETQDMFDELS